MKRRFTAAAVSVVALGLVGCSSGTDALTSHDARVSINGKATNALQPVTCHQIGRSWTIETKDKEPGFTAAIETGDVTESGEHPQSGQFHRYLLGRQPRKGPGEGVPGQVQRQRRGRWFLRRQAQPPSDRDVRHHHRLLTGGLLEGRGSYRRRASGDHRGDAAQLAGTQEADRVGAPAAQGRL